MAIVSSAGYIALTPFAERDSAASSTHMTQTLRLTKLQQSTLIDQCLPLFTPSAPREVIERLLGTLSKSDADMGRECHARRADSFNQLQRLAKAENRSRFTLEIDKTTVRETNGNLSEQVRYRYLLSHQPIVADTFAHGDERAMLRFLRAVVHAAVPIQEDDGLSRRWADARLLNRLTEALPHVPRLSAASALDELALKIDGINDQAACVHTPHVALNEKVDILAKALPEHWFAFAFDNKFSFEGGQYALLLKHEADPNAPLDQVRSDTALHVGHIGLWDNDQYAPMIVADVQRHVQRAYTQLQPTLAAASPVALSKLATSTSRPLSTQGPAADALLKNALSPLKGDYLANLPGALNPEARSALHREVGDIVVGTTTLGALWALDKEVFDAQAEQADFATTPPLLTDPQRFV